MARLVVNRVIARGIVWPRMGLLALSRIFSAGAVGPCPCVCSPRRRRVVGFFAQEPLTSNPHSFCRSRFDRPIRRLNDGRISFGAEPKTYEVSVVVCDIGNKLTFAKGAEP